MGKMLICYIDESGGCEPSGSDPAATPHMVLAGLVVEHTRISRLTRAFLDIKRTRFPGLCKSDPPLGDILVEIKGRSVRKIARSESRNTRRQGIGYLTHVMNLLENQHVRLLGRVWIKAKGEGLDPVSTYTYAMQDIARHFEHLLEVKRERGLMICDSRIANQNAIVSHSIFTQKMQAHGDAYPQLIELPVFGHSQNHAGLQLADLMASAYLFPMAARVYCAGHWTGVHVDDHYDEIRRCFARRCGDLQYRYRRHNKYTGGVIVSDKLARKGSAALFLPSR